MAEQSSLGKFVESLRYGFDGSALWVVLRLVLFAAVLIPFAATPGGHLGGFFRGAALGLAAITGTGAFVRILWWGVVLQPPPNHVVAAHTIMLLMAVVVAATGIRTSTAGTASPRNNI